jgi:RP/EB family microtubule-associated protein
MSWVNNNFNAKITRLEQLNTGTVYCFILQFIRPDFAFLRRANFQAKSDYDVSNNFKLVQQCLEKLGRRKTLAFDRLVKGCYQDHLELLQWIKRYSEIHTGTTGGDVGGEKTSRSLSLVSTTDSSRSSTPTPAVNQGSQSEITVLELKNRTLIKERDFYFEKLRCIEAMLKHDKYGANSLAASIQEIVYSPENQT